MATYNVTITTNALDNIITRFTTPTLILQINAKYLDLSQVRALSVNISQGRLKVKKVFPDEVEIKENGIYTTLSQEETGRLFVGLCDIQVHGKMENGSAWHTTVEEMYVYGSHDGVIDGNDVPVITGDDRPIWKEF